MGFPIEFQDVVHLLTADDADPDEPAAVISRADGSRQPVSTSLLAAIDHLVMIAKEDQSVLVSPVEQRVRLHTAASLTALTEDVFRGMVDRGELALRPDALGGTVALADVVALDRQFKERRFTWLAEEMAKNLGEDPASEEPEDRAGT